MACSALNCTKRRDRGVKMFNFPTDLTQRHQWETFAARGNWTSGRNSLLCIDHFADSDIIVNKTGKPKIKKGAIPSITAYSPQAHESAEQLNELPSNEIKSDHIKTLVNFQNGKVLKLAPHLEPFMLHPNNYQKMRVSNSYYVINQDVSAALDFLAEEQHDVSLQTTAWFLRMLNKWFSIASNHGERFALSLNNIEAYDTTIEFLKEFLEIVNELKIGEQGIWKPVQTGVNISTQSLIDMSDYLLKECNFKYLLTSRFSQDCVENLFSLLRAKQSKPSALDAKDNLKLISVSQYMTYNRSSSYDEDNRGFLEGFLTYLQSKPVEHVPEEELVSLVDLDLETFPPYIDNTAKNILYNIAGYILHSIEKNNIFCEVCFEDLISEEPLEVYSRLVVFKEFEQEKARLVYASRKTFEFFLAMEKVYRCLPNKISTTSANFKKNVINCLLEIPHSFSRCHNIRDKLVNRFALFRCNIAGQKRDRAGNIIYGRPN